MHRPECALHVVVERACACAGPINASTLTEPYPRSGVRAFGSCCRLHPCINIPPHPLAPCLGLRNSLHLTLTTTHATHLFCRFLLRSDNRLYAIVRLDSRRLYLSQGYRLRTSIGKPLSVNTLLRPTQYLVVWHFCFLSNPPRLSIVDSSSLKSGSPFSSPPATSY